MAIFCSSTVPPEAATMRQDSSVTTAGILFVTVEVRFTELQEIPAESPIDGYNKLRNATRCGCFAHIRRKFVDALPDDKELLATSAAAKGVEYCNALFMLERKYSGRNEKDEQIDEPMTADERYRARQTQSKPVLDAFYVWLDTLEVSGKTALAKAVHICRSMNTA